MPKCSASQLNIEAAKRGEVPMSVRDPHTLFVLGKRLFVLRCHCTSKRSENICRQVLCCS